MLIALDIDGTITDMDQRLSPAALRAIEIAQRHGAKVILVSARPFFVVEALSIYLGLGRDFIAENGAAVSIGGRRFLWGDISKARRALAYLRSRGLRLSEVENNRCRIGDLAIKRPPGAEGAKLAEEISRVLKEGGLDVRCHDTGFALHLVDGRIDKGQALLRFARILGVPQEMVVAIGDSDTDIDMIVAAGIGIAVGNATAALKKVADYVAGKPYGEGVLEGVRFVLLKLLGVRE